MSDRMKHDSSKRSYDKEHIQGPHKSLIRDKPSKNKTWKIALDNRIRQVKDSFNTNVWTPKIKDSQNNFHSQGCKKYTIIIVLTKCMNTCSIIFFLILIAFGIHISLWISYISMSIFR